MNEIIYITDRGENLLSLIGKTIQDARIGTNFMGGLGRQKIRTDQILCQEEYDNEIVLEFTDGTLICIGGPWDEGVYVEKGEKK